MSSALLAGLVERQVALNTSFHWETPAELRSNMAAYQRARDGCAWTADPQKPRHDFDRTLADYSARYLLNYAPIPVCNPFCESGHQKKFWVVIIAYRSQLGSLDADSAIIVDADSSGVARRMGRCESSLDGARDLCTIPTVSRRITTLVSHLRVLRQPQGRHPLCCLV